MLEHKAVPVNGVEVIDEERGIVSAIVSVTGMVDRVKDVIRPGAYTKTLKSRTPKGIWHHDWKKPVSKTLDIKELMPGDPDLPEFLPDGRPWPKDAGALKVLTQFNLAGERGRQAFADVVFFGPEQEWSIGYRVPQGKSTNKAGIRYCDEIDLFEYSPVLFGAMPAARTITSVKEAQESWGEVKSELFGTCSDGRGTCCLSCGEKVAVESKADHVHDDGDRWLISFADEDLDPVGTFATKDAAQSWLDAFERSMGESVEAAIEAKDDDGDEDDDFEGFMALFMEALDEVADESKGVAFRENLHKRDALGRFAAKIGEAVRDARQDVRDARGDYDRLRDPKTSFDASRNLYKRTRDRAWPLEQRLARLQGRTPTHAVSDLAAALWAGRHVGPARRREWTESLGFDPQDLAARAASALGGDDPDRRRRFRDRLNSIVTASFGDRGQVRRPAPASPAPAPRRPGGAGRPRPANPSTPPPPPPRPMPPAAGDRVPRPRPPVAPAGPAAAEPDGGSASELQDRINAALTRQRERERVLVKADGAEGLDAEVGFEAFYVQFVQNLLDLSESKAGWDESRVNRDPFGRFAKLLSRAVDAAKDWDDARSSPVVRQARADRSLGRARPRAQALERGLAHVQHRLPNHQVAELAAVSWAARHLHRNERSAWLDKVGFDPNYNAPKVADAVGANHERLGRALASALPAIMEHYFDKPVKRPGDFGPTGYIPATAREAKEGWVEIETKRYRSGWDPDQPRDAQGRWTDTPGEAAMKRALQGMQKGAETAAEMLDRLKMDEGDADEISNAYFNRDVMPAPVDPSARRILSGNPGDSSFDPQSPQDKPIIDNAAAEVFATQLFSSRAATRAKLSDEADFDLQMLSGAIAAAKNFENPDDRLQAATNFNSGKEMAEAYDNLMDNVVNGKRSERKSRRARVLAEAVQVEMISTFGQNWRERMAPLAGPAESREDRQANFKAFKRRAVRQDRIIKGAAGLIYGAWFGAMAVAIMGAKADPAEAPEGEFQPLTPGPAFDTIGLNELVMLPPVLDENFHRFDLSSLTSPDRAVDPDDIGIMAAALAVLFDEDDPDDPDTVDDEIEEAMAEGEQLAAEQAAEAPPAEQVDPAEEAKGWEIVDEMLDTLDPEEKFEPDDGLELKEDDDTDGDVDIESLIDDLIADIFGDDSDVPEEKRFNPDVHPRGPDGRFIAKPGSGGKIGHHLRSLSRAEQYLNKLTPNRRSISVKRYSKAQKRTWRRERMMAKVQKRKPSRQLAKLEAAFVGAAVLPPDERKQYLDDIGMNLDDMRRNVARDFRRNGASPKIQARVERNMATLIDLWFRSEAGYKGPEAKLDAAREAMELKIIDDMIADWDEDHVFDLMAKLAPDELEELIEGVESKAAPISEATGGRVAQPGKGNKGNIRPIMRWFERGEGAAKIRWGQSGDFMRCVHLAEKHMNPVHARGFCNKRHVAVLGRPPGQGHPGKKSEPWDVETKCLLCTGDIGADHVCTTCDADWGQKGARHFIESMVRRSNDGKFTNKPSAPVQKGGSNNAAGRAIGGAAGAGVQRAGRAAVRTAVKHPKGTAGIASNAISFALGRRSAAKKKGTGAPGVPGAGGGNTSAISGRGAATSWVDTIDALADMAGDPDSLLNHAIDVGIAKKRNGDFHIDMPNLSLGDMKGRITGKFDHQRMLNAIGVAKKIPETHPRGLPGVDETVFDLDTDSVIFKGVEERKVPTRQAEKFLAELDSAQPGARRADPPKPGLAERAARAAAKPLTSLSDARKKHEADKNQFDEIMDRMKNRRVTDKIKKASDEFEAAHAAVEDSLRRWQKTPPGKRRGDSTEVDAYAAALDRRTAALEKLRQVEREGRAELLGKADVVELTADDVFVMQAKVAQHRRSL